MTATTLKCETCGKEITGMSLKHAERLLRVHRYVKHEQKTEVKLSDQERVLLKLFKSADGNRRQEVLEGKLKTFRYLGKSPSWQEITKKMEAIGVSKSELITNLLLDWYEQVKEIKT